MIYWTVILRVARRIKHLWPGKLKDKVCVAVVSICLYWKHYDRENYCVGPWYCWGSQTLLSSWMCNPTGNETSLMKHLSCGIIR